MPEPVVTGAAGALAKALGPHVARVANEWRKGSEAKRLVDSLKKDHPAARKMLLQPDVLGHLWSYAETGELDEEGLVQSLRAITACDDDARKLAEAVRTGTWRSVRDDRRVHFDLLRVQAEMRAERREEDTAMLERIESMISIVAARLPIARQLPAEVDVFVDRETELAAAATMLAREGAGQGAVVLCCSGMAGTGKTVLALRIAHLYAEGFAGGILHVLLRGVDQQRRPPGDVAVRLLRDLGVAAEAIPTSDDAKLALLHSVLASEPMLIVLDDAVDEQQIRDLIPPNRKSVVIITSRRMLSGLGAAQFLRLEEFSDHDGSELLRTFLGERVDAEPDDARTIAAACRGLPLALAIVGARLRRTPDRPLREIAQRLRAGADALGVLDDRERAITSALASGLDAVSGGARRLLMLVAALDVADFEPELAAAMLDCSKQAADDVLEELEDHQLIRRSRAGTFSTHPLVRSIAHGQATKSLGKEEAASAQQRRVDWLVQSGDQRVRNLGETS
jgi:NB-ARC domain